MSIADLLKKVGEQGQDQTAAKPAGDYEPPAAGPTVARLVEYFELGTHEEEYQGQKKKVNKVRWVFELLGKKHAPKDIDGVKYPVRVAVDFNASLTDKSKFFQVFSRCRTDEKNAAQLLGSGFLIDIVHKKSKRDGKEVIYANVNRDTIRKPITQVPDEDGELVETVLAVPPALSEQKIFLWDFADAEMWDSVFVAGEYAEQKDDKGNVTKAARSKNRIQLEIASALNFKSLPCYDYAASKLAGDGKVSREDSDNLDDEIGDAEVPKRTEEDPDDPMKGV